MKLPEDVKPAWINLIRRLQSVAKSQGLSVISIDILVDADGSPISWSEPKKTMLEPKKSAGDLLRALVRSGMLNTEE